MTANPPPVRLCACGTEALSLETEACSCAKVKVCKRCGDPKGIGDFYQDKRLRDGLQRVCKGCMKSRKRVRRYAPGKGTIRTLKASKADVERARLANAENPRRLPMTRGDCLTMPRPCPYTTCRHHLYLDVSPSTGTIRIGFPDLEPDELKVSCSLDAAQAGGLRLEDVAAAMNMTRERARQIEETALRKLRNNPVVLKVLQGALEDG